VIRPINIRNDGVSSSSLLSGTSKIKHLVQFHPPGKISTHHILTDSSVLRVCCIHPFSTKNFLIKFGRAAWRKPGHAHVRSPVTLGDVPGLFLYSDKKQITGAIIKIANADQDNARPDPNKFFPTY